MNGNKTLVVGFGEVGRSLFNVLVNHYPISSIDKNGEAIEGDDIYVMHVCFPYSKDFISNVKKYQRRFKPTYTVIHSTVPVGTSRKCGALHSPVIGKHPNLEESILTFKKFLGGFDASELADYFQRAGIKVYLTDKPETTELLKILDTTFFGLEVEFTKEVKRLCQKYQVPFEAWTLYNENYNTGYQKLGFGNHTRPNLIPVMKKIGGHCVVPNCELLESKFTNFLKSLQ